MIPAWAVLTVDEAFPIASIITDASAMRWTIDHVRQGHRSDTPEAACWLKARLDMPGFYELADGHHRVADALLRGATTVRAELDPIPDDEPYEGPFYDFNQHQPCPVL